MRKRTKIAASAGAALAIAGAGAAVAADRLTPKSESQAVLNDAAKQLGIAPAKLTQALQQALKNRVDDLVAQGVLTKEQGDALKERLDATGLPLLTPPLLGPQGRGFGGLGSGLRLFGHHLEAGLEDAAAYLGLSEDALMEQLRSGKSLADVAKAQDKSVDGLVDVLVKEEKARLDQAVKDGRLTDAQRDQIAANLEKKVTAIVNAQPPSLDFKFGRGSFLPSRGANLDEAATYLGLSEDALEQQLRDGKTLADVAKAQGKSVDGLVDALVADEKKELQEAVDDGRLTDAQRDRIVQGLEQGVTAFVNGEAPLFHFHKLRPGPGLFPFGGRVPMPIPRERPADA
jgi:predicted DNA-binding protein (UPF0251 family)